MSEYELIIGISFLSYALIVVISSKTLRVFSIVLFKKKYAKISADVVKYVEYVGYVGYVVDVGYVLFRYYYIFIKE